MGGSASKAAAATGNAVASATGRTAGATSARVGGVGATGAANGAASNTRSAKSEEWARLLRDMSKKIETRGWDGSELTKAGAAVDAAHPAARAAAVRSKLPKSRKRDEGMTGRESGMLGQAQVVAMYKLVRRDPVEWDAAKLGAKFGVAESDLKSLLQYTRTYAAHRGEDGAVRGLYDSGADPVIARFENLLRVKQ